MDVVSRARLDSPDLELIGGSAPWLQADRKAQVVEGSIGVVSQPNHLDDGDAASLPVMIDSLVVVDLDVEPALYDFPVLPAILLVLVAHLRLRGEVSYRNRDDRPRSDLSLQGFGSGLSASAIKRTG